MDYSDDNSVRAVSTSLEKLSLLATVVVSIIPVTMSSKVVDRIDPFHNKASIKGRKQKRSQGSSHYRTKGPSELQALPMLKGKFCQIVKLDDNALLQFVVCTIGHVK